MRLCTLVLLIYSFTLPAQINLVIEDQTDQGFFLGVNGYLQNAEKTKSLIIRNLDTIPYVLHIDSDTSNFTKTIHLRQKSTHKYVLTRNFLGELKLRYRGEQSSIPKGHKVMALERSVPWPEEWKPEQKEPEKRPLLASVETDSAVESSTKPETTKDLNPVPVSNEGKATEEPMENEPQKEVLLPDSDTLEAKTKKLVSTEPEFDTPPFDQHIRDLKETEFEFEKLVKSRKYAEEHVLSTDQLREIFGILKYDNSRLQLLEVAKKNVRDPGNLKNLKKVFEYEITQKKFQSIIDGP